MDLLLRQEMKFFQFFLKGNEVAAKTEKEILSEKLLKLGMKLQLRQKMILSRKRFLEPD